MSSIRVIWLKISILWPALINIGNIYSKTHCQIYPKHDEWKSKDKRFLTWSNNWNLPDDARNIVKYSYEHKQTSEWFFWVNRIIAPVIKIIIIITSVSPMTIAGLLCARSRSCAIFET